MSRKVLIIIIIVVVILLVVTMLLIFAGLNRGGQTQTPDGGFVNPFGSGGIDVPRTGGGSTPSSSGFGTDNQNPLWKVTNEPVAAATTYTTDLTNEEKTYVRYVEKATGHIYDADVIERQPIKLSNTTIPRIQEAVWLPTNPDTVILRYLNSTNAEIQTFLATVIDDETKDENLELTEDDRVDSKRIEGSFLPDDILELAVSPVDERIFYLIHANGTTKGIIRTPQGDTETVYTSPLKEVRPQWVADNRITITTNASAEVEGLHFIVNLDKETTKLIYSNLPALTTNGNQFKTKLALFSRNNKVPLLQTIDTETNQVRRMPFVTLPEKCIWSDFEETVIYCAVPNTVPRNNYPDNWYKGVLTFTDTLWRINTLTDEIVQLAGPAQFDELGAKEGVDAVDLRLHPDEEHLTFINKKDHTLWAYSLEQFKPQQEAARAALTPGEPEE